MQKAKLILAIALTICASAASLPSIACCHGKMKNCHCTQKCNCGSKENCKCIHHTPA